MDGSTASTRVAWRTPSVVAGRPERAPGWRLACRLLLVSAFLLTLWMLTAAFGDQARADDGELRGGQPLTAGEPMNSGSTKPDPASEAGSRNTSDDTVEGTPGDDQPSGSGGGSSDDPEHEAPAGAGSEGVSPSPEAPAEESEPAEEPSEPTDQPSEPTEEPSEPADQPSEPDRPSEPTDQPSEPATDPSDASGEPAEPVADETEPPADPAVPAEPAPVELPVAEPPVVESAGVVPYVEPVVTPPALAEPAVEPVVPEASVAEQVRLLAEFEATALHVVNAAADAVQSPPFPEKICHADPRTVVTLTATVAAPTGSSEAGQAPLPEVADTAPAPGPPSGGTPVQPPIPPAPTGLPVPPAPHLPGGTTASPTMTYTGSGPDHADRDLLSAVLAAGLPASLALSALVHGDGSRGHVSGGIDSPGDRPD